MSRPEPMECTLKTCARRKKAIGDLLCVEHWKMVPRKMKQKLWTAEHLRSRFEQQVQSMTAAGEILDFIEARKVQLPDYRKFMSHEPVIETPDDAIPRIILPR